MLIYYSWIYYRSISTLILSDKMFADLPNLALFDIIVDCLVNFLRQPMTLSFPNTVWDIIGKVAQLQPMLGQALQSDDMSICQGELAIFLLVLFKFRRFPTCRLVNIPTMIWSSSCCVIYLLTM